MARRNVLKLLGASAGTAVVGTGLAAASGGPQHRQVDRPANLCHTVPTDRHLALVEDPGHEKGRGFYSGTSSQTWAFVGWLEQTRPEDSVSGSIAPDSDASEPPRRLVNVHRPGELKGYEPTDQHFAFIEDPNHRKGRGFYTGGSNGNWYFVGWLAQSRPSGTAGGSASSGGGASRPDQRLIQVRRPEQLEKYDPSDHHLAFIEDASHEKGRGFYSGGSNGEWYFIGWLAQSRPSGRASGAVDPNGSECGGGSGRDGEDGSGNDGDGSGNDGDDSDDSDDSDGSTPGTSGLSNGAWCWWGEEIEPYESWLGDQLQVVATGHGKNRWRNFIEFDTRDFPQWLDDGSGRLFLPHIPMLPREENDAVGRTKALRNLASGRYNDRFRSMAEGFKEDGLTPDTLVLRIGNEFNIQAQPYSPVGTPVSAETWAEGYRQIVDTCRDVLGDDLRTVWAPLVHATQMSTEEVLAHYPGAEYAMVGADIYDSAPAYGRQSKAPNGIDYDSASAGERETVQQYVWTENHLGGNKWGSDGVGLDDIARLADDVGRSIAIPEWGLSNDGFEWGGDVNPTFVRNMCDWMNEHDVALHAYYEHDTPQVDHALCGGEFDFATAETTYQGTFGGASVDDGGGSDENEDDSSGGDAAANYVFVTESELQTQKQRANDGKEPWASAYDDLVSDADGYLSTSLRAVTDDGGSHYFSGDDSAHDYPAAIDMSEWARDCGLAYRFTGEDRYAERAVEIIHHWCLDESTYMVPTVDIPDKSGSIEQHITIPAFVYAASMVRGHAAWDEYDGSRPWDGGASGGAEAAFRQWVRDRHDTYVESRPGYCVKNNKWAWRIADRAVTAAYLEDDSKMEKAKQMWRAEAELCGNGTRRPWADFVNNYKDRRAYDGTAAPDDNGLFKLELNRGQGFAYTAFNLKALTASLLVFERYDGSSLYGFNAPTDNKSGSSLRKAYNWFDEYVQDTSEWQWNAGNVSGGSVEKATSAFELAHAHWGGFDGALNDPDKIGSRPHYDHRLLGHVTLTHGAN